MFESDGASAALKSLMIRDQALEVVTRPVKIGTDEGTAAPPVRLVWFV